MPQPLHARSRRLASTLAVGVAFSLALAGCSADDGSSGADSADAELTLAISNQPDSFDPSRLSQSPDGIIWSSMYDRLLSIDPDGNYVANAAESWEYSPDAKVLTLTLRDDLTFSDGQAIDSAAVKATLDYTRATPGQAQTGSRYVAGVEAPDARTVVISLTQPDPLLIDGLATYLGVIADPETLGDEGNALNPLESGPYTLDTDATVTGSEYVLQRRDDYWNVEAYPFETLTVKSITDQQALFNSLQSGEIDAGYAPADQLPALEANGYTNHVVEGQGTGSIILADRDGTIVPALADLRVRQAINMALDREGFVKQVLAGEGRVAAQKIAPGAPGYVEELNSTYPFDVEAARALMADAGYADGFTVTMPSNFLSQSFEPILSQALSEIGITVDWKVMQPQDPIWESKTFAMGFWIDGGTNPATAMLTNFGPQGNFNPFGATTPELDELITTASSATDADAAADGWEAVNRYAVENALSAPIFFTQANVVTKPGITYLATVPPPIQTTQYYAIAD